MVRGFVASVFILSLILVFYIKGMADIVCPVPSYPQYKVKAVSYQYPVEDMLTKLMKNENYSSDLTKEYSVFRVIHNSSYTKVLETGFPNYIGIIEIITMSQNISPEACTADFNSLILNYFGEGFLTKITNQMYIVTANSKDLTIRTKPLLLEGKFILYDDKYAGDGLEYRIFPFKNGWTKVLKAVWHTPGKIEALKTSYDIATIPLVKNYTISSIEICWFLDEDEWYVPCAKIGTKEAGSVMLNLTTGQEIKKYRLLTGR